MRFLHVHFSSTASRRALAIESGQMIRIIYSCMLGSTAFRRALAIESRLNLA